MLARPHRLRSSADIARVYKKGSYAGGQGLFSVKALASHRPTSRAVVVVAKKISKRAVVRNRIRRRLIGLLETNWATLSPGYDIVVSVHSDISQLPAAQLQTALIQAFKRLNLS